MYLEIKSNSTYVAGMGPTAWNRDLSALKMYTPRHPVHHEEQHEAPKGTRAEVRTAQEAWNRK